MSNAKLDDNGRQTITGLLNTDGTTITLVKAEPILHGVSVDDASTGSDNGGTNAHLDDNYRPTMFALSSAGDGALVALYVNSSGELLVDSH